MEFIIQSISPCHMPISSACNDDTKKYGIQPFVWISGGHDLLHTTVVHDCGCGGAVLSTACMHVAMRLVVVALPLCLASSCRTETMKPVSWQLKPGISGNV